MKFIVQNLTKCSPRVGMLKELENHPKRILETPLAMLYTRGGSIPHITHEVYKIISKEPQIIQIPMVTTYHYQDVLEEYDGNISEFVGMKDCLTCVTVHDPGDLTHSGHHFKDHIPLWTRSGKVLLNADEYIRTVESFRPDMYYFMSDADTNSKSPAKRVKKSVDNTIAFFQECLARHKKSEALQNSFAMSSIAGGYCTYARKRCIDAVASDESVKGCLIDGLHNNGPEVEFIPFEEPQPIVEFVINNLPESKLRVMQGCWNPMVIIKLIQLGVDVFDTSYCNLVTERSSALVFSCDYDNFIDNHPYEINLRHAQFSEQFKPLESSCDCLTCRKHTRAYIHHLISVQELLGPLLLTIHNNHHFVKFFEKIRECIRNGTLNRLENIIEKQFTVHQANLMKTKRKIGSSEAAA